MLKVIVGAAAALVILAPAILAIFGRARVRACCPADPRLDRRMGSETPDSGESGRR